MSFWLNYAKWNKRNVKMSKIWVEDTINWIKTHKTPEQKKLLDFGCSYFDLGEGLISHFEIVAGFDIDQNALQDAKDKKISNARFYGQIDDIPSHYFDIIIASSVIQYFESEDQLNVFLKNAHNWLQSSSNNETCLIITDIIPTNYNKWLDAFENILFALTKGVFFSMLVHLTKVALFSVSDKHLKIDFSLLQKLSEANHFEIEKLSHNLTPSKRRYSCILRSIK